MDLNNTIIGIALFFAIAIPIYFINSASKKKSGKLSNKLSNLFTNVPSKVSDYDAFGGDSIIGMHENELGFYQERSNKIVAKTIKLNEISKFHLTKDFITSGKNKETILAKVQLDFEFIDKSKGKDSLLFFQMDDNNFMIGEELRIATKWEEKLNKLLQK